MRYLQAIFSFGLTRTPAFDYIRAAAIMLVVVSHSNRFLPSFPVWIQEGLGMLGVELFFVLSGFLIGRILIRDVLEGNRGLGHFWLARWTRTLPLYYLMLTLNYCIYEFGLGVWDGDWRYLLFLQNMQQGEQPYCFGESWSLAVEEWFYLVIPLILIGLYPLLKRRVLGVLLGLLAVSMAYKFFSFGANFTAHLSRPTFLRLDGCLAGVGLALVHHRGYEWPDRKYIGALAAFMIGLFWFSISKRADTFWAGMVFVSATVWAVSMLVFAMQQQPERKTSVEFLARISYSLYLVHLPVELVVNGWVNGWRGIKYFVGTGTYLLLSVAVAFLLYLCFELPILKWRASILSKR